MKKKSRIKVLIILLAVLAVLAAAWGIWAFFENYDFSPVHEEHYDDTTVAVISYTGEGGKPFEREVTYGEIRYYVKYYGLSAREALERVETDWVPEIIAGLYGIRPGTGLDEAVANEIDSYKMFTGEDNYEDVLAGQYMTAALHERFVYLQQLRIIVEESLCEDPESPIIRDADPEDVDAFLRLKYDASRDEMSGEQLDEALRAYAVDVYQNLFADIQADIQAEETELLNKIDSSVR